MAGYGIVCIHPYRIIISHFLIVPFYSPPKLTEFAAQARVEQRAMDERHSVVQVRCMDIKDE